MSELGGEAALPPTVPQWLRGGEAVLGAAGVGAAGDAGGRFRRTRERGTSHAKAFRQWLVRTVGLVRLCHGCGVLDVAGGKGQLSFELLNLKAVPTTVVDPRPLNVAKYSTSFRMGHYGRQPPGAAPRAPRHIQRFWEPALWVPGTDAACPVQRQLQDAWHRAHGAELQRAGGREGNDGAQSDGTAPLGAADGAPAAGETPARHRGAETPPGGDAPGLAGIQCAAGLAAGAEGPRGAAGGAGNSGGGAGGAGKKQKAKPRFRGVFFDAKAADGRGAFAACIRAGVGTSICVSLVYVC